MDILDFTIPLNRESLLNSYGAGQFFVREEFSTSEIQERLEAARIELNEEGINFIKDHFSTYFSLLQKFKQCSRLLCEKGWNTIRKSFKLLSKNLETLFEDPSNMDGELQSKMCNLTKMIFYVLMEFMKVNQSQYVEQNTNPMDCKAKKKQIKITNDEWNWQDERYSVLLEIHAFLQYPVKILWEPPIVEEEFINIIANFCYNCLEEPGIGNPHAKNLREIIFEILGTLIKNYLHGLSFCVKIVQLLKMNDSIVNPLAQGVVHLVKNCKCSNIVKEIVREIGDTDGDQLAADVSGTRSLNLFLVQLAESIPETIIPAIDLLISHLNGDSYSMRICVVGVLGEIVLSVLTKEELDENLKNMRDEYLDSLEEHIHDVNAFVRVKVLQVWQKLCIGKAIPVSRINRLLELSIGRLKDKSTNVKKQAVHLIKDLLEGNPFCCQLKVSEIQSQLQEEKKKLEELENVCLKDCEIKWSEMEPKLIKLLEEFDEFEKEDASSQTQDKQEAIEDKINAVGKALVVGDYMIGVNLIVQLKKEFCEVFNAKAETCSLETMLSILEKIFKQIQHKSAFLNLSPEVQEKREKHLKAIEYLTSALEFSELIDQAVPVILTFFESNVSSDILEAIHFFTAAYLFGFKQALEGVRKMLDLIFSKEANIKTAVSNSYKDLYFQKSGSGRHQSVMTIANLTELILKLNFNQLDALEEVVREWVRTGVIDKQFVQVMFERFSKKISGTNSNQAWAAAVLIRMVGAEESKVVKNNISVLLNEGLRVQGSKNFLIAKETCKALQHLLPAKEQGKVYDHTLRYSKDHEIIKTVCNLLRVGLWSTKDSYYIPMADEAINLIFAISHQADDVCKNLIVDVFESILLKKRPVQSRDLAEGKVLHFENNDDLLFGDSEKENEGTEQMKADVLKEEPAEDLEDFDKIFVVLLTRFIAIVGQVASNYVLYLEGPVLDELKMRNQLEYEKKLKKFDENKKFNTSFKKNRKGNAENLAEKTLDMGVEDLEFNRVAADDMDAEEMRKKTENKIVTGPGFLAQFVPLVVNICKNPGKYNNLALQNAALLTLSKFMTVSSVFCEENLQLLVTICEKSLVPERQENGMISLCALQYRFPNSLEPWTPHMYAMLQHSNPSVRYSSILVLTDLIVNEMIKVRSHISNLAICIVDKDIKIARVARHFFREYSQKGNSLYNVLPNLISNLTQANVALSQEDFKIIMKFMLSFFTKEKQSEYLVEKLCQYFESATTERQWSDLAYCLSLLNYSDKGLKKILDNMRCFANKLYLADIFEAFCSIISEAGKNFQKDKTLIAELETIVKEYRDKSCQDRNVYPVIKKDRVTSTKKKIVRRKYLPSDSEDEECFEKKTRMGQRKRKIILGSHRNSSFEEDDDEAFLSDGSSKKNGTKTKSQGNKENEISEASNSDEYEKHEGSSRNKVIRHKKMKHDPEGFSSEDEDKEKPNEKKRITRKKK